LRDLEVKLEKLEKHNGTDDEVQKELEKYFDEAGLNIIERVGILANLGLVKGEEIGSLIREGARTNKYIGGVKDV